MALWLRRMTTVSIFDYCNVLLGSASILMEVQACMQLLQPFLSTLDKVQINYGFNFPAFAQSSDTFQGCDLSLILSPKLEFHWLTFLSLRILSVIDHEQACHPLLSG
ncbi:hypothetical protein Tco_1080092 [Tanacetum coccineum]|uniref:Uncharacterized protein n=1 Tax=Tanacetum coccineum TaxID=301880 RepID=A0ABQ5HTR6_9ASTR